MLKQLSGTARWGAFEMDALARGTMAMCKNIASSHALFIVGGGAFLELMEGKTLPGVAALSQ